MLWTEQWEPVEYFDNKIICDLVESKPNGIIAIMVSSPCTWLVTCLGVSRCVSVISPHTWLAVVHLCIRAARWRKCVYVLQMFFLFFCLFFVCFLLSAQR